MGGADIGGSPIGHVSSHPLVTQSLTLTQLQAPAIKRPGKRSRTADDVCRTHSRPTPSSSFPTTLQHPLHPDVYYDPFDCDPSFGRNEPPHHHYLYPLPSGDQIPPNHPAYPQPPHVWPHMPDSSDNQSIHVPHENIYPSYVPPSRKFGPHFQDA